LTDGNVSTEKKGFAFDSLEAVRKKLLDLSGRNSLLNYKHPKASCIRVIDELPDQVVEVLRSDESLAFVSIPEPTHNELVEHGYIEIDHLTGKETVKKHPIAEQWAKLLGLSVSYDLPENSSQEVHKQNHNDHDLQCLMYAPEMEARLRSLRNKGETALEDSGSNILYLAVGFLEWFESKDSSIKKYAPLFTLPVELVRSKGGAGEGLYIYSISLKDEGLLTNVTLQEKLSNDFGLILPEVQEEITPEQYFDKINQTILKHQPNWKIRRQASLVLLNYSKQAMYQDLNPENWPDDASIEDHPIISSFFENNGLNNSGDAWAYEEEHLIDSIECIHDDFPLIYDADSSQHSALIDAVEGKNVVIEGPPGTGKSQTITNLIAACIANGQKVLFVAEKMAALNVVKSRLDKAGLGDFCLELHSHKTNKQKIFHDIGLRINKQSEYREPPGIQADIARFEDLKHKLNKYVELINSKWGNTDLTIHDILNKSTRYREQLKLDPEKLQILDIDGDSFTPVKQRELFDLTDMLSHIFDLVSEQAIDGHISNHFWYGVKNAEIMGYQESDLVESLVAWNSLLQEFLIFLTELSTSLNLELSEVSNIQEIGKLYSDIKKLPAPTGLEPFGQIVSISKEYQSSIFDHWLKSYQDIHSGNDELSSLIKSEYIHQDLTLTKLNETLASFKSLGINNDTSLIDLAGIRDSLNLSKSGIKVLAEQLAEISINFPNNLQVCFQATREGFSEFTIFGKLLGRLPSDLWRYRNDVYDNPDLDPLLDELTNRFKQLTPLYEELNSIFSLHRLPSSKELNRFAFTLGSGGIFKWLSSEWRSSRKSVLALSSMEKKNKSKLLSLLPQLIVYVEGIEDIDLLNKENDALKDGYRGIDTPLERAVELRAWYKSVRAEYGQGFGRRVAIGSDMLSLDRNLLIGISSLFSQGIVEEVDSHIEKLFNYERIFSSVEILKQLNQPLVEVLSDLESILDESLTRVEPFIQKPEDSLVNLVKLSQSLENHLKLIDVWDSSVLTKQLVPEAFKISIAPGLYSEEFVEVGKNSSAIIGVLKESDLLAKSLSANPQLQRYDEIISSGEKLLGFLTKGSEYLNVFSEKGSVNVDEWTDASGWDINSLINRNLIAIQNPKWLGTWVEYIRLRNKLHTHGLDELVTGLEEASFTTREINNVVNLAVYHQLSNEILSNHGTLAQFSGMEHSANRKKFQEYDRKLMVLQRELIAYKASRVTVPAGTSSGKVGNYTELGLIQHNLNLKKPRVAVRSLVKKAGGAIHALKPCFMMSPMSVAQYLEPGQFDFDVVIMDEASQIRPEDALGAIARGKSLVVVGDPKQLPPTSFFQKAVNNEGSEDESVALESSESILESVIPMFKSRRLRWHYRSRHESLIAFSNYRFYDSNLILFPSPMQESDEFGIRHHKVKMGRFVNRRNVEEGQEVARAIANQLINNPHESVGVVAMSSEQRDEIERVTEQLLKDEPAFQKAYEANLGTDEPLFIKNLENVQGDERDIIIISMTYGPATAGASNMYQRFGPINSDVGWRRLNVLFTRSKKRMHIFTSMDSGHIRTSETSSRGVVALKSFLEFCETGRVQHYSHTGKSTDSEFEVSVMNALAEHGYECEPQLGVTGYFLDLAVRDPGQPGRFLMGIECDGASYHSAKSARDRDRLRQDILESLGWNIRRIWSTDWFKNPQSQLAPILTELDSLKTKESFKSVESLPVDEEVVIDDISVPDVSDEDVDLKTRLVAFDENVIRLNSPHILESSRLLRSAMLEALLQFEPCSKAEFLETIPEYLRTGTDASEGQYLEGVLEIISNYC